MKWTKRRKFGYEVKNELNIVKQILEFEFKEKVMEKKMEELETAATREEIVTKNLEKRSRDLKTERRKCLRRWKTGKGSKEEYGQAKNKYRKRYEQS